jgi:hypothetical protein
MILINFDSECPYCGMQNSTDQVIDNEIDNDHLVTCESCEQRYLIHWFMVVDSEVYKIESVRPPVRCRADLMPYYVGFSKEDEDDEPQA